MARVWAWAWVAAAALLAAAACARVVPAPPVEIGAVSVVVIEHASLVLLTARATVWVDPVGTVADYEGKRASGAADERKIPQIPQIPGARGARGEQRRGEKKPRATAPRTKHARGRQMTAPHSRGR